MDAHLPDRPLTAGLGRIGRELALALLVAVLLALFARTFVVQAFRIPTPSMAEGLVVGDHLLANRFVHGAWRHPLESSLLPLAPVRRGEVVVFTRREEPGRAFIKRCVAVAGDRVEIRAKQLVVNGAPVEEPYVVHDDPRTYSRSLYLNDLFRFRDQYGPYIVPEGHVFLMGDNRDRSHDSRYWGAVPASQVVGRAFVVYWSLDESDGGPARSWHRVRWHRLLTLIR